jgi:hypothetical protein
MASAVIIFCRETRSQVPPGGTYADAAAANAVIARLKKKSGVLPGEPNSRTYDVVNVTVP